MLPRGKFFRVSFLSLSIRMFSIANSRQPNLPWLKQERKCAKVSKSPGFLPVCDITIAFSPSENLMPTPGKTLDWLLNKCSMNVLISRNQPEFTKNNSSADWIFLLFQKNYCIRGPLPLRLCGQTTLATIRILRGSFHRISLTGRDILKPRVSHHCTGLGQKGENRLRSTIIDVIRPDMRKDIWQNLSGKLCR